MKLPLLLLVGSLVRAYGQTEFIVDQGFAGEFSPLGFGVGNGIQVVPRPYGQTFTPTLPEIGFILVNVADARPANQRGATLYVDLYTAPAGGQLLGSSVPVALPDSFRGGATFLFDPPVALVPGVEYFFSPQAAEFTEDPNGPGLILSDLWGIGQTEAYYPGGTRVLGGRRDVGINIWFREGVVVPEPSSWALGLVGGVLFGALNFVERRRDRPRS